MSAPKRFIGLAVHKSVVVLAAVDQQQTPVMRPRRIATSELREWSQGNLRPTDEVVLEAWYSLRERRIIGLTADDPSDGVKSA